MDHVKPLDFLCIGAPKAGTTSLFHYLKDHPNIEMPATKEAPFFSDDNLTWEDWSRYFHKHFNRQKEGALFGKITPQYFGDHNAPKRIHEMMPDLALIALLRDPIERCFSDYKMRSRHGMEKRTFNDAVAPHIHGENRDRDSTQSQLSQTESYVARSEYGRILSDFLEYFPKNRILVLFSEQLADRPGETVDEFLSFVGLAPGYRPKNIGRRYHKGSAAQRFPGLVPRLQSIALARRAWRTLPEETRSRIYLWYKRELNVKRDSENESGPSPELRAALIEHYRPDVALLERKLGVRVPWADYARR